MESPGPGVHPIVDTLRTDEELSGHDLFYTDDFRRSMEYIDMHNNEEKTFIGVYEQLPDRCNPLDEGLFIAIYIGEEENAVVYVKAMLTYRDEESGEVYTYFILSFEYDERLRLTKIDATECGA